MVTDPGYAERVAEFKRHVAAYTAWVAWRKTP